MAKKTNKTKRQQASKVKKVLSKVQPKRSIAQARPNAMAKTLMSKPPVPLVCGLVDPFCDHARNAKYPDDSSSRTLPQTCHTVYTVSTNATGECATFFSPSYAFNVGHVTANVGTAPSYTVNTATANPNAQPGVSNYRIVSWGFRIKSISAPLYRSGVVHVRVYPESEPATSIDGLAYNGEQCADIPLSDLHGFSYVGQHSSQPPANFYQVDTSGLFSDWVQPGYSCAGVYLDGGPGSTAVLQVETVVHYELLFDHTAALSQFATPSPPHNPLILAAANRVTSTAESMFEGAVSRVGSYLERKALEALGSLGPRSALMLAL